LQSVIVQDPGPARMQIEVVDDGTSDLTEEVVRAVGGGRIGYFRNPTRLGKAANFTQCVRRSYGRWVQVLNDDDLVLPDFYANYERFIADHPEVVMVFSRAISIDENGDWQQLMNCHLQTSGIVPDALGRLVQFDYICADTAAVARSAYERVGGFAPWLPETSDWEMWMRIASAGPIGYLRTPGLLYRVHPGMETNRIAATGELIAESVLAIRTGLRLLPPERRAEIERRAFRAYASEASVLRARFEARGDNGAALRNAVWALRLRPSIGNAIRLGRTAARAIVRRASAPAAEGTAVTRT
jgi:hypothetical protein